MISKWYHFSNTEIRQVFLLYRIASLNITSVKYFYLTDKLQKWKKYKLCHKILYNMGDSLHFKKSNRKPGTSYLFYPHLNFKKSNFLSKITKITSTPTSIKPTKIKHFTTFNTIKNHHYSTKNTIKPLKIKHFLELNKNHTSNKEI